MSMKKMIENVDEIKEEDLNFDDIKINDEKIKHILYPDDTGKIWWDNYITM